MRASTLILSLIATVVFAGCASEPPPPVNPKIIGRVNSVSSADIAQVLSLEREDMLKRFGKVVPIAVVRVVNHNFIKLMFSDGRIFGGRYVHRVKGRWKLDPFLEGGPVTGANAQAVAATTNQ